MASKSAKGSVTGVFSRDALAALLQAPLAAGKGRRPGASSSGAGGAPAPAVMEAMIQSILQENGVLGQVPGGKRKVARRKKGRKTRTETSEREEQVNPLERIRSLRNAQNNIHQLAALAGIAGDDVSYLERQFAQIKTIVKQAALKLQDAFSQLVGVDSMASFTAEDASLLLMYVGMDVDEQALNEICRAAELKSSQPADSELSTMDFFTWRTGVVAWLRQFLMAGVLAERRGETPVQFLDAMSKTSSVSKPNNSAVPPPNAPPPPGYTGAPLSSAFASAPASAAAASPPAAAAEGPRAGDLFDDSLLMDNSSVLSSRRRSKGDLRAGSIGPGASLMSSAWPDGGPSMMSQTSGASGLPPLRLKQLEKMKAVSRKKLLTGAGFNASLTRGTPRCLRDELNPGEQTIEMLKRELKIAQEGLQQLGTMVDTNIVWVHKNTDMAALSGGSVSLRTRERCQKMAVERLFSVISQVLISAQSWTFLRWRRACQFDKVSSLAKRISRLKAVEQTTSVLYEVMTRQFLRGWSPWIKKVHTEQRWEQEAAVTEIQRVARGFCGRRRAKRTRRFKATIVIQCMFRCFKARRRVRVRRAKMRFYRAAKRIQWFFKCIALRKQARRECVRRRKLREQKKREAAQKAKEEREARNRIMTKAEKKAKEEAEAKAKAAKELEEMMKEQKKDPRFKGRAPPASGSPTSASKATKTVTVSGAGSKQIQAQRAKLAEEAEKKRKEAEAEQAKKDKAAADKQRKAEEAAAAEAARREHMEAELARLAAEKEAQAEAAKAAFYKEQVDQGKPTSGILASAGGLLSSAFSRKKAPSPIPEASSSSPAPAPEPSPTAAQGKSRRSFDGLSSILGRSAPSQESPTVAPDQPSPKGAAGGSFVPIDTSSTSPAPSPKVSTPVEEKDRVAAEEAERKRLEKAEKERLAAEEKERKRAEKEEKDRLAAEEKAKAAAEAAEKKRLEKEEKDRIAAEEKERKRLEKAEKERLAAEEAERKRAEKEELEKAAKESAAETAERHRFEKEEKDRLTALVEAEAAERKRREKAEKDRIAAEEAEKKRLEKEERDRIAAEEKAKAAAEAAEKKRLEKEEKDRVAAEEAERKRLEKAEKDRLAAEDADRKRAEKEEKDRIAAEEKAKAAAEAAEKKRIEKEEKDRIAAEAAEKKRLEKEEKDRIAAEAAEKKRQEKAEKDRLAAEEKERKRIEKEALAATKPQTPGGGLFGMFSRPGTASAPAASPPKGEADARPPSAGGSMFSGLLNTAQKLAAPGPVDPKAAAKAKASKKKSRKPTGPPPSHDEAVLRLQLMGRVWKANKKTKVRRESMMKEQKRAGQLLTWAIVTIQSVARMRQGRIRWNNFHAIYLKDLAARQLYSAKLIQRVGRGMVARRRVKRLWKEHAERVKAEEWKKYQAESGRRAKAKAKEIEDQERAAAMAAGKPRTPEPQGGEMMYGGIDLEQIKEIDEKIARMEELERRIADKEKAMQDAALKAEERTQALEKAIKAMEERAKAEEAERAIQKELLSMAAGPISNRSPYNSARPGTGQGSARGGGHGPPSARPSARDQPPSARSARGGAGIPPDAPKVTFQGDTWVQLWDPDERANYWYCERTQQAQWEEPGRPPDNYSGYESSGAMTDYSTDGYTSGGSVSGSEWGGDESEWQEFWDESAQAKYWYNNSSGEASWTKPAALDNASLNSSMASIPVSARSSAAGAMDWVSYLDEETGQEYWFNAKTGETSWA